MVRECIFLCLSAISFSLLWLVCSCLLPIFLLESVFVFYCYITYFHKLSNTHFVFHNSEGLSLGRVGWVLCSVSLWQGWNQGVAQAGLLTKGSAKESSSKLIQLVGRFSSLFPRSKVPVSKRGHLSDSRPPSFLKVAPILSKCPFHLQNSNSTFSPSQASNLSDFPSRRKRRTFMGSCD